MALSQKVVVQGVDKEGIIEREKGEESFPTWEGRGGEVIRGGGEEDDERQKWRRKWWRRRGGDDDDKDNDDKR